MNNNKHDSDTHNYQDISSIIQQDLHNYQDISSIIQQDLPIQNKKTIPSTTISEQESIPCDNDQHDPHNTRMISESIQLYCESTPRNTTRYEFNHINDIVMQLDRDDVDDELIDALLEHWDELWRYKKEYPDLDFYKEPFIFFEGDSDDVFAERNDESYDTFIDNVF